MGTILDKVRLLCQKNDVTLAQIEKELGFGNKALFTWKDSNPGIDKVKKVADYFGVSVDYLLSDDDYDEKEHIRQMLFDTPGKRILFSAMDGATENDLLLAAQIIEALKGSRGK